MPITTMIRFTYFKVNSYFDNHHNQTLNQLDVGQEWCKYVMERFVRNEAKAQDHMVTRMCAQACLYQVDALYNPMSIGGGQHT